MAKSSNKKKGGTTDVRNVLIEGEIRIKLNSKIFGMRARNNRVNTVKLYLP